MQVRVDDVGNGRGSGQDNGHPGPGQVPPRHPADPGPGQVPPPRPDPRKLNRGNTAGRGTEIDPFADLKRKIMDEHSRGVAKGNASMDDYLRVKGRDPESREAKEFKEAISKLLLHDLIKHHGKEIEEIRSKLPPRP